MRNPILVLWSILAILILFVACRSNNRKNDEIVLLHENSSETIEDPDEQMKKDLTTTQGGSTNMADVKVKLTINSEELIVNIYESLASRNLLPRSLPSSICN